MWKAKKIELKKNSDEVFYREYALYFRECYTLLIDGQRIHNAIYEGHFTLSPEELDTDVCTECGQDGCSGATTVMIRRHRSSLLFLPDFSGMDGFQQMDTDTGKGNRYCPPHIWYVDGILEVEGIALTELLRVLPQLFLDEIPIISKEEIDLMLEWEIMLQKNQNEQENVLSGKS